MKIWARKTVFADFDDRETELLINASLYGDNLDEAIKLLKSTFGGEGYIHNEEMAYQYFEYYGRQDHPSRCFRDLEWE